MRNIKTLLTKDLKYLKKSEIFYFNEDEYNLETLLDEVHI
jgi:hypothetical protein